jgi:MFS family permease
MEMFSGLARRSYLVCIGWTTLIISNNVATVGQIFFVASITYILAGPFIGIVIDRYKRRKLIILAQLSIAASMLCMGGLIFYTRDVSVLWLFATVITVSSFRIMYRGAFDGIIKASVDDKDILATLARANFIHLFSMTAGTAAIGFIIQAFSPAHAFVVSAAASLSIDGGGISCRWNSQNKLPGICRVLV